MLDIKFVRENPDIVKENIRKKFQNAKLPLVDEAIALDAQRRQAIADGESLKAKGIIKHADALVKVLGDGEITKALTVRVDKVSASAKAKIEAAGGKVELPC